MKYVFSIVYLSLFLSLANCITKEEVSEIAKKCGTEFNMDVSRFAALEKALESNTDVDNSDKCYTSCMVKTSKLLQNGKIDLESLKQLDDVFNKVDFGPCQGIKGSDECDTNYQLVKCGVQQYEKVKS